ncbi:hypothetical protein QA538_11315 (plasmid) [Macrococcus sp. CCM 2573]
MRKIVKSEKNYTGSLLGALACIITYFFVTRDSHGNITYNIEPDWMIAFIPLSGLIVFLLFQYVIKYDFFKK